MVGYVPVADPQLVDLRRCLLGVAAAVLLHGAWRGSDGSVRAAGACTVCATAALTASTLAATFVTAFVASSPMEWATVGHRRLEGLHLLR